MLDSKDLVNTFKQISMNATKAGNPVSYVFGKVINANPIQIQIEQKIILEEKMLVIPKSLTDYEIEIEPTNWSTENTSGGSGESSFASHSHQIIGKKKIKIYNALKKDENVLLAKMQGGQKYIVIDKVG